MDRTESPLVGRTVITADHWRQFADMAPTVVSIGAHLCSRRPGKDDGKEANKIKQAEALSPKDKPATTPPSYIRAATV